jgi:SAM-dependent methyltransferase
VRDAVLQVHDEVALHQLREVEQLVDLRAVGNGPRRSHGAARPPPAEELRLGDNHEVPGRLFCRRGPAPARPRIWIAGCGTFQPYAFAQANPRAEIVATDLSEPSLDVARRRCRLHRQTNVRFAPVDLDDASTWPDGTFDLIECYGVLMNVADPLATLRGLAAKLNPNGVLRLMVYPHWSRQRVFQLQRLAKLLGFDASRREHPAAFRTFVKRLPTAHPLRYAFTTYADSRNDAGVVDAFLHAGDRGFTGHQLGALLQAAGLVPEPESEILSLCGAIAKAQEVSLVKGHAIASK